MGTYSRTLFGLVIGGVTCAVLIAAGGQIYHAFQNADLAPTNVRTPREQVYSVAVETLCLKVNASKYPLRIDRLQPKPLEDRATGPASFQPLTTWHPVDAHV